MNNKILVLGAGAWGTAIANFVQPHRIITHAHRNLSRAPVDLSCRRFAPGRTQLPGTKSPAWVPPGLIVAVRPGSPLLCGLVSTRLWQLLQPGSGQSHLPRPRTRVIAVASVKRARCNAPIVSCFTWFRGFAVAVGEVTTPVTPTSACRNGKLLRMLLQQGKAGCRAAGGDAAIGRVCISGNTLRLHHHS